MAKKDLDDLISGEIQKPVLTFSPRSTLHLDRIQPRDHNTRELRASHVATLAESIAVLGLLEPIVVDMRGLLLAGGHRLAAIKLLKDSNPTAYTQHFPSEQVPVRTMGFDAQRDPVRAFNIEVAENEQRRDYTPAEVRAIAELLKSAGYSSSMGRPAQGEKPLRPQLEVIVGKSIRQVSRYLNDGGRKSGTFVPHSLKRAKADLEKWVALKPKESHTKAESSLLSLLPRFLKLIETVINEETYKVIPEDIITQAKDDLLEMCAADERVDEYRSPFLETNRQRVREIGEQLNQFGGRTAMVYVYERLPKPDQRELDYAWDGIGEWRC